MMDTRGVRSAILMAIVVASLAGACSCDPQVPPTWPSAAAHAAQSASDARIVVLDISSGHLLAASHLAEAARTLAAPGSTLKPLVLYGLVASGRWDQSRRIACTLKLRIAGRSLNCSHPPADPMDARQALTWSCNTYFAALAGALAPGQLRAPLAPTGLLSQTGLAPAEAIAVFHDPQTPDATRLALLGVDGVLVTPLELATAYRWLAVRLAAPHPEGTGRPPASAAAQVVRDGLQDSASFGMAGAASLGGVPIAGKTGTASPASGGQSHGWFVGLAPSDAPHAIIVVYLPAGHGADAARVAADLLAHCPLRQPQP
jgi:cell division protein FtsI/penicillin-binding protein 2